MVDSDYKYYRTSAINKIKSFKADLVVAKQEMRDATAEMARQLTKVLQDKSGLEEFKGHINKANRHPLVVIYRGSFPLMEVTRQKNRVRYRSLPKQYQTEADIKFLPYQKFLMDEVGLALAGEESIFDCVHKYFEEVDAYTLKTSVLNSNVGATRYEEREHIMETLLNNLPQMIETYSDVSIIYKVDDMRNSIRGTKFELNDVLSNSSVISVKTNASWNNNKRQIKKEQLIKQLAKISLSNLSNLDELMKNVNIYTLIDKI